MNYVDENYVKSIFKERTDDAHKGNFGKVLIFAGSVGMAGAAILCGKAALQSGAGLVQFLLPDPSDPIYPILQTAVPEATCVFYKEGMDFSSYTSIAAGSGLGKSAERLGILKDIITRYGNVLVLDADALNLISEDEVLKDAVINSKAQIIITPHIGEAKRLLHTCEGIKGITARKAAVSSLAEMYNCIAILKGAGTLVCCKNDIYQNTTGNPGMATAGSGDTLTGIIASLVGQGYTPFEAACLGVYFHGKAGDLAAKNISQMGLTAGDIAHYVPYSFKLN